MERIRSMLHADEAYCRKITGKGITAVILDSGINEHPDYADRILAFGDFVNGKNKCYDDASHGSHVSGILGGDGSCSHGRYRGIAPECSLIHLKVLDHLGQGNLDDIINALEWIVQNQKKYQIRVVNISAGTTKGELDENSQRLVKSVERVWDAGIVVTVASGNMGPKPMSITVPGNSKKVITVGAFDSLDGRMGSRRNYSGCGPTQACICKPELVAPGTDVISCSPYWRKGTYYSKKSGTSMAAPAVAGCAVLLLQKEPWLTNVEVKMRLKEAAVDLGLSQNRQGWGMPDIRKLLWG